jgi:hypothetical protein
MCHRTNYLRKKTLPMLAAILKGLLVVGLTLAGENRHE